NVRELEHVIERAVLFAERETLTARDLFEPPFEPRPLDRVLGMARAALLPGAAEESLASDAAEAKLLAEVLKSAGGSLSRAAALLGVSGTTLRYRLQKLGLLPKKDEPNR